MRRNLKRGRGHLLTQLLYFPLQTVCKNIFRKKSWSQHFKKKCQFLNKTFPKKKKLFCGSRKNTSDRFRNKNEMKLH